MNQEGMWISPAQIVDSTLLSLSFDVHLDHLDESAPLSFTLDTEFDRLEREETVTNCVGIVKFDGSWGNAEEGETAFTISCILGIAIDVDNSVLGEDVEDDALIIRANALSLAYGKIRALIESTTAQSIVGKQTIPAINAQAYFEASE